MGFLDGRRARAGLAAAALESWDEADGLVLDVLDGACQRGGVASAARRDRGSGSSGPASGGDRHARSGWLERSLGRGLRAVSAAARAPDDTATGGATDKV